MTTEELLAECQTTRPSWEWRETIGKEVVGYCRGFEVHFNVAYGRLVRASIRSVNASGLDRTVAGALHSMTADLWVSIGEARRAHEQALERMAVVTGEKQ